MKTVLQDNEYIIFDAEYYSNDISFLKGIKTNVFLLTKQPFVDLSDNIFVFTRPFCTEELIKKINETKITQDNSQLLQTSKSIENIEFDNSLMQVTINGNIIKFSQKEFELFRLLFENRGKVLSRRFVLDSVWGKDYDQTNNVDNVYINYLRKKVDNVLGLKLIYTIRNQGYVIK